MLRSNLSTRPFYNERAVHLLMVLAAVVVLAFTVFNIARIRGLSRENTELAKHANDEESRAQQLSTAAQRTRARLDLKAIEAVSASAHEANAIIDRRLFSWTELFNYFETTLPDDVRITSVRPQTNPSGNVKISMTVIGRSVEEVDRFMVALEDTRAFRNVLSIDERTIEDGDLLAVLDAEYLPSRSAPPGQAVPAPLGNAPASKPQ